MALNSDIAAVINGDSEGCIAQGDVLDVLRSMPDGCIQCVVTSPPYYGLRDYGTGKWEGGDNKCDHSKRTSKKITAVTTESMPTNSNHEKEGWLGGVCGKCGARCVDNQIGLEKTMEEYVAKMVEVFREIHRVLRDDGVCWLNLGDSYNGSGGYSGGHTPSAQAGSKQTTNKGSHKKIQSNAPGLKPKDLCGIPWRVAFALQADGWWLRSAITWCKGSPMPESVTDRPTNATEMVFLLTKSQKYYYDSFAVRQPSTTRTTNLTSFSSSTLAPKNITTFKTDNISPNLRGELNFCKSQITINGTMAFKTTNLKIIKSIRFTIIGEVSEWDFMMDLQSGVGTASLASITSFLKGLSPNDTPIRATITNPSAPPSRTSNAHPMTTIPEPGAFLATKDMLQVGPKELLASIVRENTTALVTLHFNEFSTTLFVFGTFRSSHADYDNKNTNKSQGRNLWNWWLINSQPYPKAHFAVFPEKLVEPCILAGTSQEGCCPECGTPWTRIVEKDRQATRPGRDNVVDETGMANRDAGRHCTETKTVGWEPGCECRVPVIDSMASGNSYARQPIPCVVLDPFMGAGTTAVVSRKLNRRWIGVELNEEYCEMARNRVQNTERLLF